MAKKPRAVNKHHIDVSTELKREIFAQTQKEIHGALKDMIFEVEGTPMAVVLMKKGGEYRNKPLAPTQELTFRSISLSDKTGKIIIRMEPVDAQEWVAAEFNPDSLDEAFPLMGGVLGEKVGVATQGESFPVTFSALYSRISDKLTAQHDIDQAVTVDALTSNPLFGRF